MIYRSDNNDSRITCIIYLKIIAIANMLLSMVMQHLDIAL